MPNKRTFLLSFILVLLPLLAALAFAGGEDGIITVAEEPGWSLSEPSETAQVAVSLDRDQPFHANSPSEYRGAFPGEMVTANWSCPEGTVSATFTSDLGPVDGYTDVPTDPNVRDFRFGPVTSSLGAKDTTVVCHAPPSEVVLDTFYREDGNIDPAGNPWVPWNTGNVQILDEQLAPSSQSGNLVKYGTDSSFYVPADGRVFVTWANKGADSDYLRLLLRGDFANQDGYLLRIKNVDPGTDRWELRLMDNGAQGTVIGSNVNQEVAAGDKIKFEADGDTLTGFLCNPDCAPVIQGTNSTYTADGYAGVGIQGGGGMRADNFGAGSLTGGGVDTSDVSTTDVVTGPDFPSLQSNTWDTSCDVSYNTVTEEQLISGDDPIVFPNQDEATHDHAFLGADDIDEDSTGPSIIAAERERRAQGVTAKCQDSRDFAAYWVPLLYRCSTDALDDCVAKPPIDIHVYYRGNDTTISPPLGFGAVSMRGVENGTGFACGDAKPGDDVPITVKTGPNAGQSACTGDKFGRVVMIVKFPQCWDGENLRKADNSHVANAVVCANLPNHPYRVPSLTFSGVDHGFINLNPPTGGWRWAYRAPDGTYTRIVDDAPGVPETDAITTHGDFFNAWDPFRIDQSVHQCSRLDSSGGDLHDLCHSDDRE